MLVRFFISYIFLDINSIMISTKPHTFVLESVYMTTNHLGYRKYWCIVYKFKAYNIGI